MSPDPSHRSVADELRLGSSGSFGPEELLARTLESLSEAVFVVETPERRIAGCNPAAEQMFGYEEQELLGARTKILHLDEEHFERFDEETRPVLAEGRVYRGRFRMARKDGSEIETEHVISPLHFREGRLKAVVSVIRDVSELRHAGAEIGRANAQLRRLARFSEEVETAIYRIVQEARTNVARHAGVTVARVQVEPHDGSIRVRVTDEGAGFDPEVVAAESETVGLSGMRERAGLLGGRFEVESAPGEGTRITVLIPVQD